MSPTIEKTAPSQSCFCHHCKRDGFRRAQLTAEWLCPECAILPDARGWRDPYAEARTRGLRGGSPEYWERTQALRERQIVGDDEPDASATPPATATKKGRKAAQQEQPSAWVCYQRTVLASAAYTPSDKFAFLVLCSFADYATGARCYPTLRTLAERSGQGTRWWGTRLRRLQHLGLVRAVALRTRHGWGPNLYVFVGHGFAGPEDIGGVSHLSTSTRPPGPAHDAQGRWTKARLEARNTPVGRGTKHACRSGGLEARNTPVLYGNVDLPLNKDPSRDLSAASGGEERDELLKQRGELNAAPVGRKAARPDHPGEGNARGSRP